MCVLIVSALILIDAESTKATVTDAAWSGLTRKQKRKKVIKVNEITNEADAFKARMKEAKAVKIKEAEFSVKDEIEQAFRQGYQAGYKAGIASTFNSEE